MSCFIFYHVPLYVEAECRCGCSLKPNQPKTKEKTGKNEAMCWLSDATPTTEHLPGLGPLVAAWRQKAGCPTQPHPSAVPVVRPHGAVALLRLLGPSPGPVLATLSCGEAGLCPR